MPARICGVFRAGQPQNRPTADGSRFDAVTAAEGGKVDVFHSLQKLRRERLAPLRKGSSPRVYFSRVKHLEGFSF